jgi:ubiquinol-cytochrome c reductase cytochrome b subunit
VAGILNPDRVAGPHYFGNTAFKEGEMVTWVNDTIRTQLADLQGDELAAFRRKLEDVTFAVSAESGLASDGNPQRDERIAVGREVIVSELACIDCHKFRENGELGLAPDLTGYASREWLVAFISNPAHERFYRDLNDRMPAFATSTENPALNRLSADELALLVSWLRGEWYEPTSEAQSAPQAQ